MEPLIQGKTRQVVIAAIKSLHPVMLETWGDRNAYREQARAALIDTLGRGQGNNNEALALAEQILQLVQHIRALQLRHIENPQTLNQAQKTLEPTFATAPLRLGCLQLAAQLQHSALSHLDSGEGQTAYKKVISALDGRRTALMQELGAAEGLNLEKLELILVAEVTRALGKSDTPFYHAAIAGRLIERVRRYARQHPSETAVPADFSDNSPETRLISALEEPVRRAELHDARQRFSTLNEYQKGQRYEALRKVMLKHVGRIAPTAPQSFDAFCQAVESIAYPYPVPLEWVRVFLKPLYTNAQQSSTFDKCRTVQSVNHRYEQVLAEKGANPLMLHLARAFALATLKVAQAESLQTFLQEVDLVSEFNWPPTLEAYKSGAGGRRGAAGGA